MEEFVAEFGVGGFDHLADEDSELWTEFGVTSQPAFVFINDDGSSEILISALGLDGLTERVKALAAA
jgi:thioredoxin-related protein